MDSLTEEAGAKGSGTRESGFHRFIRPILRHYGSRRWMLLLVLIDGFTHHPQARSNTGTNRCHCVPKGYSP